MQISSIPKLSFFKIEKYEFQVSNVCDFSNQPRPHSCMGLILEGEADFLIKEEKIHVVPGDIIFVPITSKYVSVWNGEPSIKYISMHFIFDTPNGLFTEKSPLLQKITLPEFEKLKSDYEYIFENADASELSRKMEALGKFHCLLSQIISKLKYMDFSDVDKRLLKAKEYINSNYSEAFSVEDLAKSVNMSVSSFHAGFKKAFGISPISYKNKICIRRATGMLTDDKHKSIEEISESLGFSSSVYFRRIFKSETGKTPREYRANENKGL